jgi:hypothetical protein
VRVDRGRGFGGGGGTLAGRLRGDKPILRCGRGTNYEVIRDAAAASST